MVPQVILTMGMNVDFLFSLMNNSLMLAAEAHPYDRTKDHKDENDEPAMEEVKDQSKDSES